MLWADGAFNISRYLAAILSAAPFTAIYAVSNTVFLLLFARPIGKILDRLKTKYALRCKRMTDYADVTMTFSLHFPIHKPHSANHNNTRASTGKPAAADTSAEARFALRAR